MLSTHPASLFLLQLLTISFVIGFTDPRSPVRPAALPLVASYAGIIVLTARQHMRGPWAGLLGGTAVAFLLQYLELSMLSRRSFEADGHMASTQPARSGDGMGDRSAERAAASRTRRDRAWWERFRFGLTRAFAFRNVNVNPGASGGEVKNVPRFSAQDPGYVPSRREFLLRAIAGTAVCYLVLDLAAASPPAEDNAALFSAQRVPILTRLRDVTVHELTVRLLATLGFWVNLYCLLLGGSSALSAIAVGCNASPVESWRPMFGSLAEAYTLRRFWSNFWHQTLRQPLTGAASFLTDKVLRLPRGTLLARYTRLLLTFAISGLLHMAADVAGGTPWERSGTVRFFCTQVLGIMIEDGVAAAYRSARGTARASGRFLRWVRGMQYVWVAVFLVWSTPAWLYPVAAQDQGRAEETQLPFSVVKRFMQT